MLRRATQCFLLFLFASLVVHAQGRRISTFPHQQDFAFITPTTTALPTTNVIGGEFTPDAGTSATFVTAMSSAGLNNNNGAGGALQIQVTNATTAQGVVYYANFTGYNAGTLSLDWMKIQNTPNSSNTVELHIATNGGSGSTFTDIPGVTWPVIDNSTTAQNNAVTVTLPTSLNNQFDVRIRMYVVKTAGTGNNPAVLIDNLIVGATPICSSAPGNASIDSVGSIGSGSMKLYYFGGGNADSVLIIRATGATPTATPVNGTRYFVGQGFNVADTVVYFGPANARVANFIHLAPSTAYTYTVYGMQTCNGAYSTTGTTVTASTLGCGSAPGNVVGVSDISKNQTSVRLAFTPASRTDSIIIFRSTNAAPSSAPVSGFRYFVGQRVSPTDTVAYIGPAVSPAIITGLQADSLYYFAVYGMQSCNVTYSALPGVDSARTYCLGGIGNINRLSIRYASANAVGFAVNADNSVGNVMIFSGGNDTLRPVVQQGKAYTVGDVVGDDTVRYIGAAKNPVITGLAAGTLYKFYAVGVRYCNFGYSAIGDTAAVSTTPVCSGSSFLGTPDSIVATKASHDTLILKWRRATNANGYLLLARADTTPTNTPTAGVYYGAGDSIGRTMVLAHTSDTTVTLTGVPQNVAYFIKVLATRSCDLGYGPASNLAMISSAGTSNSQRFGIRAGRLDSVIYNGARLILTGAPTADGSVLITRRSGAPTTGGIPHYRMNRTPVDILSSDRWWSFDHTGMGSFTLVLKFDITGIPGIQDTSDLDIIYRPNASSLWSDIVTGGKEVIGGRRYLITNPQSFLSDYAIGGNTGHNILPVKLTSYEAIPKNEKVLLRWQTASEMNTAGYQIERADMRADGSHSSFEIVADYASNSALAGAGMTTHARNYQTVDEPNAASKRVLYRLKEVDLDGTISELGTIEVEMSRDANKAAALDISPNPVSSEVATLVYSLAVPSPVTIALSDMRGNAVGTIETTEMAEVGTHVLQFNVSEFPNGVYFCRIKAGEVNLVKRIVIAR